MLCLVQGHLRVHHKALVFTGAPEQGPGLRTAVGEKGRIVGLHVGNRLWSPAGAVAQMACHFLLASTLVSAHTSPVTFCCSVPDHPCCEGHRDCPTDFGLGKAHLRDRQCGTASSP